MMQVGEYADGTGVFSKARAAATASRLCKDSEKSPGRVRKSARGRLVFRVTKPVSPGPCDLALGVLGQDCFGPPSQRPTRGPATQDRANQESRKLTIVMRQPAATKRLVRANTEGFHFERKQPCLHEIHEFHCQFANRRGIVRGIEASIGDDRLDGPAPQLGIRHVFHFVPPQAKGGRHSQPMQQTSLGR